jgi:hypothetical protein
MSNILIERIASTLDRMTDYQINEEAEGPDPNEDDRLPGMHPTLHDFLFHLSSPVDKTTKTLAEAVVLDVKKGIKPQLPSNMVKSQRMIDTAHSEGLGHGENLHKRIGHGMRSELQKMQSETHRESRAKLREAKAVFRSFSRSRGLGGERDAKMMRGNMKTNASATSLMRGNIKTEKSKNQGVLTTGLNLAPHTLSGMNDFDVCPNSSSECRQKCLGLTAGGNKIFPDHSLSSKILRTQFIAKHPEHAVRILDSEISAHKRKAKRKGLVPGFRLNMTSDIAWEHHAPELFKRHSDVQFYDYTKSHNRVLRHLDPKSGHPSNYHLSLSSTGTGHEESNDKHVGRVLHSGGVVAMVFKSKKLPTHVVDHTTGRKFPVIDGNSDDNTFDRHAQAGLTEGKPGHGVVSGLTLKGIGVDPGNFAVPVDEDGIAHINKGHQK